MNSKRLLQRTISSAFFVCLFFYSLCLADDKSLLIGVWQSTNPMDPIELVFQSHSRLIFDGESADYALDQNVIRVSDSDGITDYPYTLSGNELMVSFPDGYQLMFTRIGEIKKNAAKSDSLAATRAGSGGPDNSELAREIAGIWWGYSGATERKIGLCPNGAYQDYSESGYSGSSYDSQGNQTQAWGVGSQSGGVGTWRIQGDFQRGTIFVQYINGGNTAIHYEQIGEPGCLLFNGQKLCRSGLCE